MAHGDDPRPGSRADVSAGLFPAWWTVERRNALRAQVGLPRSDEQGTGRILEAMTTPGNAEMVTIPRAELDAMKAELRRLQDALDDQIAKARILAYPGPGKAGGRTFETAEELAQAMGLRG
jgi:hypothetical protein